MSKYNLAWSTGVKVIFFVFLVAFYFPNSAKVAKNIFYIGIALPAAYCVLRRPLTLSVFWGPFAWLLFAFFALAMTRTSPDFTLIKNICYLLLLYSACFLLERYPGSIRQAFTGFALVGLLLLIYAAGHWIWQRYTLGLWVRQQLWNDVSNPVHIALLIMSSLVFLWIFYVEAWLTKHSDGYLILGIALLVILGCLCGAAFQARSAMLGFSLFMVVYLTQRKQIVQGVLIILFVVAMMYWLGLTDPLLERGMSFRLDIWKDAIQRVRNDCGLWRGCGADEYRFLGQFYHPHSGYVSVFYRFGLLGSTILGVGVAIFFWHAYRVRSSWMLVSLVGWGGLLTSSNGVFTSPQPLWVYFWVPILLALLETQTDHINEYFAARNKLKGHADHA